MSRNVNVVAAAVGGPWPSGARVLYDWGDRSEPSEGTGTTKAASHTYAVEGIFRIRGQVYTRDMARIGGPAFTSYDTTPVYRINSMTPTGGPPEGGTPCVIDGQQLTGATAVFFAGAGATNVQVLSDTSVSCVSPAGTPEALVNVNVMRGTASNPLQFQYGAAADEGEAEA
jgi:hypothetical protein